MSEAMELSAAEIARRVNAGEVSAREVTDAALAQIDAVDDRLGAYLTRLHDLARVSAGRVDARIRAGEHLPLAGVPVAVKDNMCLAGTRTTCGSKMLEGWVAPYTATAVARLLDAGAVPVGVYRRVVPGGDLHALRGGQVRLAAHSATPWAASAVGSAVGSLWRRPSRYHCPRPSA